MAPSKPAAPAVIEAPDLSIQPLFPQLATMRSPDQRKLYVEEVLIGLVEAGDLYLTGVLLQAESDTVGEVLFGLDVDPNLHTLTDSWATDQRLLDATVQVESIEPVIAKGDDGKPLRNPNNEQEWLYTGQFRRSDRPITYKKATKVTRKQMLQGAHGHNLRIGAGGQGPGVTEVRTDNIVAKPAQCELTLRDAWTLLKSKGMYVAPAVRVDHRARKWQVREVPPAERKGSR